MAFRFTPETKSRLDRYWGWGLCISLLTMLAVLGAEHWIAPQPHMLKQSVLIVFFLFFLPQFYISFKTGEPPFPSFPSRWHGPKWFFWLGWWTALIMTLFVIALLIANFNMPNSSTTKANHWLD
jgi:hypothetical protein